MSDQSDQSDTYSWTWIWDAPKGYTGKSPIIEFRNGKMYVQMGAFHLVDPTDADMRSLGFKKKYHGTITVTVESKRRIDEAVARREESRRIVDQPLSPLIPPLLREILDERARQDELWGVQHHPSFPEMVDTPVARSIQSSLQTAMSQVVDLVKATVDCSEEGQRAWAVIFFEEVLEALNEVDDWTACRKELIQCAAVILNWVNDADEREVALEERSSEHA